MKRILVSLVFFHTLLVTFPVFAEEGHVDESVTEHLTEQNQQKKEIVNEDNPPAVGSATNELGIGDFLKLIFTTIFIIALIYFLLKFVNKRNRVFNQYKFMENIGGTSLGTNRSIQLIKVGKRILVVGVGESIQLLKEIDDHDEMNEILEHHNTSLESMGKPRDIVNRFIERYKNSKSSAKDPFSSILKQQLSELSQGRKRIVEQLEDKESNKE
ncbi:flagellar biosynthetic protein FliO [Ferdinandcohnia quinoae]|uniref:Flagellar biosynthetic protein FliO n=1 Tax=Fredinandcohnia quinoae TaxID=2918902 RepID=A0AAW5E0X2_9BACI|nr:flagellar biosynthetic protein FliO [Fredinandcohnia sp. SECRCQ15]MCH1623772.1 flagellar biosynthetic protein FliO [Fredinandcohnia sp. SECRCQ15]